jgi:hypothetical protein
MKTAPAQGVAFVLIRRFWPFERDNVCHAYPGAGFRLVAIYHYVGDQTLLYFTVLYERFNYKALKPGRLLKNHGQVRDKAKTG